MSEADRYVQVPRNLQKLLTEINTAPSGFQLGPDMARNSTPQMFSNGHGKPQSGATQISLAVGPQRSQLPNFASNGTTVQNSFIGLGMPAARDHMEDLAYWTPQAHDSEAMNQIANAAMMKWGADTSLSQQLGYTSQSHDYANAMMMNNGSEEVLSSDIQVGQMPNLQELAYWNAMQIYGLEVQPELASQLPYYTNANQYPPPAQEAKVQFCSCGKAWVPTANFCANCGARRPADAEAETTLNLSEALSPELTSGIGSEVEGALPEDDSTTNVTCEVDQPDHEQQAKCEAADPDARALSDDIAAQVARFLQSGDCDSEEEAEEEEKSNAPKIDLEDSGSQRDTVSEAETKQAHPASPDNASSLQQPSSEAPQPTTDAKKVHPCLVRGARFAASFKNVPLKLEGHDLEHVAKTIVQCLETLYKERTRPLVRNVQRLLYIRGYSKRVVQCVLGICVNFTDLFEIWLPLDMQPCILLRWYTPEDSVVIAEESYRGKYDYDFLAELAAWVHNFVGGVATNGHVKATMTANELTEEMNNESPNDSPTNKMMTHLDSKHLNSVRKMSTLMLRNIPASLTNAQLEKEIKDSGFAGTYDFIHCPRDINKGTGAGYAFVNFVSHELAFKFACAWHSSQRFGESNSINVSAAQQQGLEANLKKWSGARFTRLKNPGLRPIIRTSDSAFPQK